MCSNLKRIPSLYCTGERYELAAQEHLAEREGGRQTAAGASGGGSGEDRDGDWVHALD